MTEGKSSGHCPFIALYCLQSCNYIKVVEDAFYDGGGLPAIWSSIQVRTGAIADQTVGTLGFEQGDIPQAKTPTRTFWPFVPSKTAGPPLSALQTFPELGNMDVHIQLLLNGLPGRRASKTSRHNSYAMIGRSTVYKNISLSIHALLKIIDWNSLATHRVKSEAVDHSCCPIQNRWPFLTEVAVNFELEVQ